MKKIIVASALALSLSALPSYAANMIAPDGLTASTSAVTVGTVSADKAGYLVVHEANASGTAPGAVIGHAPVQAGDNSAVKISLEKKVKAGANLIVMLHEESNGDTKFDPKDVPAMTGGKPVQQQITVQ